MLFCFCICHSVCDSSKFSEVDIGLYGEKRRGYTMDLTYPTSNIVGTDFPISYYCARQ